MLSSIFKGNLNGNCHGKCENVNAGNGNGNNNDSDRNTGNNNGNCIGKFLATPKLYYGTLIMGIVLASVRMQTPVMYGKGDVNHSGKTDRKEEVNCIEKSQIAVSKHNMWALKDSFNPMY